MKRLLFTINALLILGVSGAGAEIYSFKESDSLERFYAVSAGPGAWKWASDAGADGSGGGLLAENVAGTSVLILKEAMNRPVNGAQMKVVFQWAEPTFGLGHGFFIGLAQSHSILPAVPGQEAKPTEEQLYIGVGRREEKNSARLVGASASNGQLALHHAPDTVMLTPGEWVELSAELTQSGERLSVRAALHRWVNGAPGEELARFEFLTQPIPSVVNSTQWYPYLGSGPNAVNRGVRAVDSLTVE